MREHQTHFSALPEPIATLAPGEMITLHTPSVLTRGELPRTYEDLVIPVVGPVAIDGAKAGDTVVIELVEIEVAAQGAMVALPGYGAFGDLLTEPGGRIVQVRDGRCVLWEGMDLPVTPMVGKIGVGVPDEPPRSNTVGDHGGNMDCKMVRSGSRVILPVLSDGALIYVGDAHARQADGECLMTAVEVEANVTLRCTLRNDLSVVQPVIVVDDDVLVVGHGATLDEAVRHGLHEMHRQLRNAHDWSIADTAMFMSAMADAHVCQIVNPRASAHVTVPALYLPQLAAAGK